MPATNYYAQLGTITPQEDSPSNVEKVLYRLDNGGAASAADPVLLGYQVGDKLYSDIALQAEVTAALHAKGKRIVETIPFTLAAPETKTADISLAWAISESSFHTVTNHPGNGAVLPFRLEVAVTTAVPTDTDYAIHDVDEGTQAFTDNTAASEQITLDVVAASYRWMRMRRTDTVGGNTASASVAGQITVVREVRA